MAKKQLKCVSNDIHASLSWTSIVSKMSAKVRDVAVNNLLRGNGDYLIPNNHPRNSMRKKRPWYKTSTES